MKRTTTGIVVAMLCAAFGHPVQAAGMKGFDIHGGVEFFGVSSRESFPGDSYHFNYGGQSTAISLGAGYSHRFGGFNLGTHVNVDIGDVDAGREGNDFYSFTFKLKSLQTWSIEPGWAFGDNVVAYLRLAYLHGKIKAHYSDPNVFFVDGRGSSTLNAPAFGFGLRAQLTQRLYLAVEADRARFRGNTLKVDFWSQGFTVGSVSFEEKRSLTRGTAKLGWMF